jgi:terminase small subunit-like protein
MGVAKKPAITQKTKKATPKKTASSRSRAAGIALPDDEKIPRLTVKVRMRVKGKRGNPRKWDYDRLMAYVCERIGEGRLVSDVCRTIDIRMTTFWNIADSTETYRVLYGSARRKQADAIAQNVQKVAEGRDRITAKERKRVAKLRKGKNLGDQMYANVRENNIIQRNRLQIDAAKWYAKVTDPDRFGEKSSLSLNSGENDGPISVTLRFVDGKGKDVTP